MNCLYIYLFPFSKKNISYLIYSQTGTKNTIHSVYAPLLSVLLLSEKFYTETPPILTCLSSQQHIVGVWHWRRESHQSTQCRREEAFNALSIRFCLSPADSFLWPGLWFLASGDQVTELSGVYISECCCRYSLLLACCPNRTGSITSFAFQAFICCAKSAH